MIRFARSVPDAWGAHGRLAGTAKGMGVHALILDVDVGPLLQTQKLITSVLFARRKGYSAPLTAAELEMMNLTGDGNGFDMVQMRPAMRQKVPTSNFFQQGGDERNPVAIRNNTVAKLFGGHRRQDAVRGQASRRAGPRCRIRRGARQGADRPQMSAPDRNLRIWASWSAGNTNAFPRRHMRRALLVVAMPGTLSASALADDDDAALAQQLANLIAALDEPPLQLQLGSRHRARRQAATRTISSSSPCSPFASTVIGRSLRAR